MAHVAGAAVPPQFTPLTASQRQNAAGGFVFKIDDEARLRRFLILGCESGTAYAGEKKVGLENAQALLRLLDTPAGGARVLALLREVSLGGLAHKQGPTMLALAACARRGDVATRRAAYDALPDLCRIPTHLFQFLAVAQALGSGQSGEGPGCGHGWGRMQRRAITQWYAAMPADRLAFVGTKYARREGWAHRDVLLMAHVRPASPAHQLVQRYLARGWDDVAAEVEALTATDADGDSLMSEPGSEAPAAAAAARTATQESDSRDAAAAARVLAAVHALAKATTADEAAILVTRHQLAREHVPGPLLAAPAVWKALAACMPPTALLRNLGKLGSLGELDYGTDTVMHVVAALQDTAALHRARVHPMTVLLASSTYESGSGVRGGNSWAPNPDVIAALDAAFYASFKNVVPAGKRVLLALDVSGSMGAAIGGTSLSCAEASMAMALVTLATEPWCRVMAFASELVPLPSITAGMPLAAALGETRRLTFGPTDCAQPMLYALSYRLQVDLFVVYTDNETWFGDVHPATALQHYRQSPHGVPDARLAVVGMTASEFSIADPEDAGMLDFVGFDASTPQALSAFAADKL